MSQPEPFRVLDHTLKELEDWLEERGIARFRGRQIRRWMLQEGVLDPAEMTDLPVDLRHRLASEAQLRLLEPVDEQRSLDGSTRKTLFRVRRVADHRPSAPAADRGGAAASARTPAQFARFARRSALDAIESVLMLYEPTESTRVRQTVCVSTQIGCAVGCPFCATGKEGLAGNLTSGEIVEQLLHFVRHVREVEGGGHQPRITNVVFMGMGEPLHNYRGLIDAIKTFSDPHGPNLGARHMTVSTSGLVPQIRQLAHEPLQIGLAVSLHAANDRKRDRLVPVNRKYPIAELLEAIRYYQGITGRRVTFEWALMEDINDSVQDARELAALCRGLSVHVNLIPMNPVPGTPFHRPPYERTKAFQRLLDQLGVSNTLRVERGVEISAACGQLRAKHAERPTTSGASVGVLSA